VGSTGAASFRWSGAARERAYVGTTNGTNPSGCVPRAERLRRGKPWVPMRPADSDLWELRPLSTRGKRQVAADNLWMATPPNQASGYGSTGKPPRGKVKPKGSPPHRSAADRWNDNSHHTTSYTDHLANIKARRQIGTTDLTAPPTAAQAITEANSAADLQFGPKVRAAQQQAANVAPWFADYMARIAGYATAAKTQMQPVLDQGAKLADPATAAQTQAAPGLDPNSEAGRASAMAAQGRAALAALGQQANQTNAQSTQDYFSGLGATAAREQPLAQQAAADQLAGVQSDRGAAISTFLRDARANAQNYAIARGTLGANIANSQADAQTAAAGQAEQHRHNVAGEKHATDATQAAADAAAAKGREPNQYGVPADQWAQWSTSHRQRVIDAAGKKTGPSAADQKHVQGVRDKSTAALGRLDDINKRIGIYSKDSIPVTEVGADGKEKPVIVDGKGGKKVQKTRPPTEQEITNRLLDQHFSAAEISLAKKLARHEKLTPADVEIAHGLGIRVPRKYLPVPTGGANTNPVQQQGTGDMR
jgi:hypothetical protein